MHDLLPQAHHIATLLKSRGETIAIAESSTGGLLSAALLAVPGASAYFQGGAVIYTRRARTALLGITETDMEGIRSASEPYAALLAHTIRTRFATTWGLAETGAAGPTGNSYGDAPGHTCLAIDGPIRKAITLETASPDRPANMHAFAQAALAMLIEALSPRPPSPL